LFKQRKHKTFNYKPRFSENDREQELEEDTKAFASKWRRENAKNGSKIKGGMSMRFLILALVLLLICMYILEKKYM
jgi:ABC-type lipoprotein release transport system permease subunit